MQGSTVTIKNKVTGVESPIPLDSWERFKANRAISQAFDEVDTIHEPPEVAALRNQAEPAPGEENKKPTKKAARKRAAPKKAAQ